MSKYLPTNCKIENVLITKADCRQWIADLRSGNFVQTKGLLKRTQDGEALAGHCCLGVFAERHPSCLAGAMARERISPFPNDAPLLGVFTNYYDADEALPHKAVENVLAESNDAGEPFPVIADWVETYLLPCCEGK
jgi:hypothetical protein